MNFKEIENIENQVASTETAASSSYQMQMLSEYLEKEKRKSGAKENPFVYFYEDVISNSLSFNFQSALGEPIYKNASDDALSCLNICNEFYKLSSWSVNGWLQNALKFADNIVLHYIQDCCKEIPKSYPMIGVEKARYVHLSEKEGDISTAGAELKDLYDLRNDLEHRTKIHADGKQELIPPKRNKVRHVVVKLYPDALRRILKAYKTTYPE
ncbi:MAG: hypothetical protein JSR09_09765 [Bacteroidetes bacterium]|nr:hypothetical protein [Bacteroidota bacterium]